MYVCVCVCVIYLRILCRLFYFLTSQSSFINSLNVSSISIPH